jgi:hypothetical protein
MVERINMHIEGIIHMQLWAIRNKNTNKFLGRLWWGHNKDGYGWHEGKTPRLYSRKNQATSALTQITLKCKSDYEIVELDLLELI